MDTFEAGARAAVVDDADALLIDVASKVQLSPSKHEKATANFKALCEWVDRPESPLRGLVFECYPSGSFATGTATLAHVATSQHDVDVVIELKLPQNTEPQIVLQTLFDAINGQPGSRYHGKVRQNSRCVTVTYDDDTSVDLMPVVITGGRPREAVLFHHKPGSAEAYTKPVNPWGFKEHFNNAVGEDPAFAELFSKRRLLLDSKVVKADVQPMPAHVPLEEKSPRVVGLQLIKRQRDLAYRRRPHARKPPSVVLAAISLEVPAVQSKLIDEVLSIARQIRTRLRDTSGPRGTLRVFNPAYPGVDEFTDRWPEDRTAQTVFDEDLRKLIVDLQRLRNENLNLNEQQEILRRHFGETAATYAINKRLEARRADTEKGRLRINPATGRVLASGAAAAGVGTAAAHAGTKAGGVWPR